MLRFSRSALKQSKLRFITLHNVLQVVLSLLPRRRLSENSCRCKQERWPSCSPTLNPLSFRFQRTCRASCTNRPRPEPELSRVIKDETTEPRARLGLRELTAVTRTVPRADLGRNAGIAGAQKTPKRPR